MNNAVIIQNLSKRFNKKQALSGLSLSVRQGSIVGLLGPNGCGKTTLIKILAGMILDYQGQVLIRERTPSVETKPMVAYLPDRTFLPGYFTSREAIRLFSDFFMDFDENRARGLLERFTLDPDQKIRTMSKGMQEKLQILLVMSRRAKLYLLDEPLGGVDPATREVILDLILENYQEDAAVIISTQLIAEVERIFDHVIFLQDGKLLLEGEVDALRQKNQKSMDALFREVYQC